MRSSLKLNKAQFFILSAFAIVSILLLISNWISPYTIIDTSSIALMDEPSVFNNIKEKAIATVQQAKTCDDLNSNLDEYKNFVTEYASSKNFNLNFLYSINPTTSQITTTSSTTTTTLPTQNLMAYWKFDEGSGMIASDSSGNSNTGTLRGNPTWITGKDGTALSFDGASDAVSVLDANSLDFDANQNFSVAMWVNYTGVSTFNTFLLMKSQGFINGSSPGYWIQRLSTDRIRFVIADGTTTSSVTTTTPLNDSSWYFIVTVRDTTSNRVSVYVDGALNSSAADTTTASLANNANLTMGARVQSNDALTNFFSGTLDEVQVWNKALSATEVNNLYQAYIIPQATTTTSSSTTTTTTPSSSGCSDVPGFSVTVKINMEMKSPNVDLISNSTTVWIHP